jgi:hypothetical protein
MATQNYCKMIKESKYTIEGREREIEIKLQEVKKENIIIQDNLNIENKYRIKNQDLLTNMSNKIKLDSNLNGESNNRMDKLFLIQRQWDKFKSNFATIMDRFVNQGIPML